MRIICASIPFVLLAAITSSTGCGNAENTPQQAFESLRTALKEQRWDMLYDLLPPDLQNSLDAQIATQVDEIVRVYGKGEAERKLKAYGVTLQEWQQMDRRERFSRVWKGQAREQLAELKVDPDEILNSEVKDVRITGERAEFALDDGRGHRSRLSFVLKDDRWRFDLGG